MQYKLRDRLVEEATISARNSLMYDHVKFFRVNELRRLQDAKLYAEANDLERLAMRSALLGLLNEAELDAGFGYETENEKQQLNEDIAKYRADALKLAEELGIDAEKISQKFDSLNIAKIEPYKPMSYMMKEWYPNPLIRAYKSFEWKLRNLFSRIKSESK